MSTEAKKRTLDDLSAGMLVTWCGDEYRLTERDEDGWTGVTTGHGESKPGILGLFRTWLINDSEFAIVKPSDLDRVTAERDTARAALLIATGALERVTERFREEGEIMQNVARAALTEIKHLGTTGTVAAEWQVSKACRANRPDLCELKCCAADHRGTTGVDVRAGALEEAAACCEAWCGTLWDSHEHVGGEIPYQDEPRLVRRTRCFCTPECRSAGRPMNVSPSAPLPMLIADRDRRNRGLAAVLEAELATTPTPVKGAAE